MPYTAPGYKLKTRAQVLLPAARRLLASFRAKGTFETMPAAVFKKAFTSPNKRVNTISRDEVNLFTESGDLPRNSQDFKDFCTIFYHMMEAAGLYPKGYLPAYPYYRENPIMSLDELIYEALSDEIVLNGPETYDGENTRIDSFWAEIPAQIVNIALVEERAQLYLEAFRAYMGDLLYKMRHMKGFKLSDPHDRSWFEVYYADASGKYRKSNIGGNKGSAVTYTVAPLMDRPEVLRMVEKLKTLCLAGPWLKFTNFKSNKSLHRLAALATPNIPNLEVMVGKSLEVGPFNIFRDMVSTPFKWDLNDQFSGFLERITYASDVALNYTTTGYQLPTVKVNSSGVMPEMVWDFPVVDVELIEDPNAPQLLQGMRPVYSWRSVRHDRRVSTDSGANMYTFLVDLLTQKDDIGVTTVDRATLSGVSWVDLSDSTLAAKIQVVSYSGHKASAEVYYVENGNLYKGKVDLTYYYHRTGTLIVKPAMIEFINPSRQWYRKGDPALVSFFREKLGLNDYDFAVSEDIMHISAQLHTFSYLTGRVCPWQDHKAYVEALTNKTVQSTPGKSV